jgi:two-component system phosphate regulon sensor histidine kinase PhoR
MASKKIGPEKYVAWIVAFALIGLISVQVYWARRTYSEAETVFNDKIIRVLNKVRDEANDAAVCFTMYSKTYLDSHQGIFLMKSPWENKNESELWMHGGKSDSIPMFFNVPEEYKSSPLNKVYKDIKFSTPVTAEILLKFRFDLSKSSPDKIILSQNPSVDNFRELIRNHEALLSIYDTTMIDSLIRYHLKSNNIPVEFAYALVKTPGDSVEYVNKPQYKSQLLNNGIRARLTPEDLFNSPYDIILYSKNKPEIILRNIAWILSLSIGIILLLLIAYIYFIRTILKQKKLSEMKNDFINNMTHEFNTPIANISLAYETLINKEKIIEDDYSDRVVNIIQSETNRLKDNVTRILKISSFERNGMQLTRCLSDAVDLVDVALSRFELNILNKNAIVRFNRPDHPVMIVTDRMNILSAIENLIDNALKYSNENCRIEIDLLEEKNNVIIRIKDNGIGMSGEELDKIFEKFYRVQHGNIQNDRGFGLGLNYTKHIIEAHGGTISVKSRKGEGSCFTICLPKDERKS